MNVDIEVLEPGDCFGVIVTGNAGGIHPYFWVLR